MRLLARKFSSNAESLVGKKTKKPRASLKAKATSNTTEQIEDVPFPLMKLPPELRRIIYKLALVESTTDLKLITHSRSGAIKFGHIEKGDRLRGSSCIRRIISRKSSQRLQPALLRVSKHVYNEAAPILYGQTFHFEYPVVLQKFLLDIGPANRRLLQRIVLRGWIDIPFHRWRRDFEGIFDKLSAAVNLQSLHLDRHVKSSHDKESLYALPINHLPHGVGCFVKNAAFWAQTNDYARGKGTAKAILTFSDLIFGSKDDIANDDETYRYNKQYFLDNIKFD